MSKLGSVWVYLPDDEEDETLRFAGQAYALQPNTATEVAPHSTDPKEVKRLAEAKGLMAPPGIPPLVMANHFVATHGRWGVAIVSGPVTNSKAKTLADQSVVDAAEKTYVENTQKWAEDVHLERLTKNKPRQEAGLKDLPPTAEETKAEAWLKKHKLLA